ncbi:dialkylresorcinol condensing enzyme DarA [Chryseobacterium chendengshani]|uniref:dialkylrecorsinol condensing enzyme DarA n=1 Tax=Chryseobacterium sp. LJ668 TaxID=2864040 RepID=UPI001C68F2A8|nr:dialkylrecorsinol condensing enzyme DarA [Chryseobacterium sp. LJ668]MBW8522412.1 dialkylresorcinol condensing enzyme DarA [Chryseobacterium sp. LJ668]QYK18051.1 dialkylresorcinol condensing enzyme DarA [Chryseobacterium sp. LJ668]
MQKNVLVLYYTQTGQLEEIMKNIARPFEDKKDEYKVTYYNIRMKEDFPFPWSSDVFFNTFPESYLQIPSEILPPPENVLNKKYDLILFGYQVWYLTPSIPIISFLKSGYAEVLLKDTPVVTVSGTRNMWMLSQEKLKVYLKNMNAKLVGNIALVDRHDNYTSVLTILRWLTTGQKEKSGMLPAAGVSNEEINGAGKYGKIIENHFDNNDFANLQPDLVKNGAVEIRPFLVRVEKVGNKIFIIWSNLIMKKKEKRPLLIKFFKVYLMAAIWIISPIVLVFHILLAPVLWSKRQKQKEYLQGINLK